MKNVTGLKIRGKRKGRDKNISYDILVSDHLISQSNGIDRDKVSSIVSTYLSKSGHHGKIPELTVGIGDTTLVFSNVDLEGMIVQEDGKAVRPNA